ncbi:hypothetical protein [Streptomyces indiaensis]|nr:hypothetical protein [Streptomyces indiaensis]MCF1649578.1 hypothetical protein [Streptomyces indiaensis]
MAGIISLRDGHRVAQLGHPVGRAGELGIVGGRASTASLRTTAPSIRVWPDAHGGVTG